MEGSGRFGQVAAALFANYAATQQNEVGTCHGLVDRQEIQSYSASRDGLRERPRVEDPREDQCLDKGEHDAEHRVERVRTGKAEHNG